MSKLRFEKTLCARDPFDSVTWGKRDIVQKDKDGNVRFELKGAVFPTSWSDTSANIVASKYFRTGETSLRDLIDRVVGVYVKQAIESDYFETESDLVDWRRTLEYMLVNQMFSFNSPVWFNVGVDGRPQQISACFLLDVEDDMESIFNWYTEEGMIFKGGSGAGANLSKLRGDGEPLTSGGTASGPISFMRGADSSAGAVKSGGTTRRSAKMIALDIDHPDIEEFIDLKASEERKIRALAAAGFDMGLGGKDITSVQYQNANNSVMITDQFMYAVKDDKDFDLIRRTDGGVSKTVKARKLWRQIAQRAWECADPGVQFFDAINDWHTLAPFGPIVTSNPCLRGDTPCPTLEGLTTIAEWAASGETRHVWDGSEWVRANATLTGVKPTVEVKLSTNRSLYMTANHKIMSNGQAVEVGNAVGMTIDVLRPETLLGDINPALVVDGMLHGDGTYHKATGAWYLTIGAKDDDMFAYAKVCGDVIRYREYPDGKKCLWLRPSTQLDQRTIPDRMIPESVYHGSVDDVRSFLRGLYSANGNVVATHKRVNLKSTNRAMLHQVMDMLTLLGIRSSIVTNRAVRVTHANGTYESRESYSVVINGSADVRTFTGRVGIVHGYKIERLDAISVTNGSPRPVKIIDVVPTGKDEPVYDYHMEKTHHGCIAGFDVLNCGEYLSIPNSSCNLGSLNLVKFLRGTDFDYGAFEVAVRTAIIAMDISIEFADFPTKLIGENSRKFRQLGLGYANLGALLMRVGYGYDSDEGRTLAANITAFMTGVAYDQSALLAEAVGPYVGYELAKDAHQEVIRKHCLASQLVVDERIANLWMSLHSRPLRNSQVTLLAPTGTIGLAMGCDTTGIEPEFSLVKYKEQVDGVFTAYVNGSIADTLRTLGYGPAQVEAIVARIMDGLPHRECGIREEHLPVFATAVGDNAIEPMGHVRMMAAVQPFLSGAISKTVNLPADATVDDVENIHYQAWERGLKSLAIYRDGSKNTQVLSATKESPKEESKDPSPVAVANASRYPGREKMPKRRPGRTTSFSVGGAEGYLTASEYPDGRLGEIFIKMSKQGSTLSGVMDAFAISVSVGLQYGVPLAVLVKKFTNMRFEPAGRTDDGDVRLAQSIMDYIFRRLAIDYLMFEERQELGILTASERMALARGESLESQDDATDREVPPADVDRAPEVATVKPRVTHDAPLCLTCGMKMRPAGACHVCEGCGATSGCS